MTDFVGLSVEEQAKAWAEVSGDRRPRITTDWEALDAVLPLGGLRPGSLVAIAGRTHTRKTAVAINLTANLLKQEVPVLFAGLDEDVATYTVKLASAFTGIPHTDLGEREPVSAYTSQAERFTLTKGHRPSMEQLSAILEIADLGPSGLRPRVVFIDYLTLLYRDQYAGQDVVRVPRLMEDLKVWAGDEEVVCFVLHQVGRADEGGPHLRNHGHKLGTLESMKYGGEEAVDVLLYTSRPELDPLGNMDEDEARANRGKDFDLEDWQEAQHRVETNRDVTVLQLLKNRGGTRLCQAGIRLRSIGESQKMVPADQMISAHGLRVVPDTEEEA